MAREEQHTRPMSVLLGALLLAGSARKACALHVLGDAVHGIAPESLQLLTCEDTDAEAADTFGDACRHYEVNPRWCEFSPSLFAWDDDDFTSADMCCACGGGAQKNATLYMGSLGTQCAENELILSSQVCEQALAKLNITAPAILWDSSQQNTDVTIPRGCAYRPGADTCDHAYCASGPHMPHFSQAATGHGRGDLQPVCLGSEATEAATRTPASTLSDEGAKAATPTPASTPSDARAYGPFMGCFVDASDRDLPKYVRELGGAADIGVCAELCSEYVYFGLQWDKQCRCGNSFGKHGSAQSCSCTGAY